MKILCFLLKLIKTVGFIFCFHAIGIATCSSAKDTTFQLWWHLGSSLNGHTGTEVFLLVFTIVSLLFFVSQSVSHLLNDNEITHMYTISIIIPIVITKPNYVRTIKDEILLHEGAKYYCKERKWFLYKLCQFTNNRKNKILTSE